MNTTGKKDDNIIALVDCNNFYVSCERVFNPKLNNKPVAILSNNDGCIVSRSQEIKDLKIPMGAPGFKYESLIKKQGGTLLSSNYALYADMSSRVMDVLGMFSPDIEIYSIDEAFLGLNGFKNRDLESFGRKITRTVFQWTGIPVSVGISKTKTLAKVANHFAKRYSAYQGSLCLLEDERIEKALAKTPVSEIWGIGRQYDKFIEHYLTSMGLKTVLELRGYACIDLDEAPAAKKSIVTSRSFGKQVSALIELQEAVSEYVTRAAEKLRKQKCVTGLLMVFLSTNRFKEGPQYNNSLSTTLFPPTAYTPELIKTALDLLEELYLPGFEYKKAGVMLADIIPEKDVPLSFMEINYLDDKRKKLMETIDKLNKTYGQDTLFYASSGINKDWKMKRAKLSPHYTTHWKDIPKVK